MTSNAYDESRYNFARFEEPQKARTRTSATKSSTAPKQRRQAGPQLKLIKGHKTERKNHFKTTVKASFISFLVLISLSAFLYSKTYYDELGRQETEIRNEIKIAESDKIRYETELRADLSLQDVRKYAENELGMVEIQPQDVIYLDLGNEDAVLKVDGEAIK